MSIISQVKKILNLESSKQDIVSRLLEEKQITTKEAAILLEGTTFITFEKIECTSGGKVVLGEDNTIDS